MTQLNLSKEEMQSIINNTSEIYKVTNYYVIDSFKVKERRMYTITTEKDDDYAGIVEVSTENKNNVIAVKPFNLVI